MVSLSCAIVSSNRCCSVSSPWSLEFSCCAEAKSASNLQFRLDKVKEIMNMYVCVRAWRAYLCMCLLSASYKEKWYEHK